MHTGNWRLPLISFFSSGRWLCTPLSSRQTSSRLTVYAKRVIGTTGSCFIIQSQITSNKTESQTTLWLSAFKGTARRDCRSFFLNKKLTQVKGSKNRQHLSFPIYLISVRMNKCYSARSLPYLRGQIGISPVANEIGYINGIAPFSQCQLSKGNVVTVYKTIVLKCIPGAAST